MSSVFKQFFKLTSMLCSLIFWVQPVLASSFCLELLRNVNEIRPPLRLPLHPNLRNLVPGQHLRIHADAFNWFPLLKRLLPKASDWTVISVNETVTGEKSVLLQNLRDPALAPVTVRLTDLLNRTFSVFPSGEEKLSEGSLIEIAPHASKATPVEYEVFSKSDNPTYVIDEPSIASYVKPDFQNPGYNLVNFEFGSESRLLSVPSVHIRPTRFETVTRFSQAMTQIEKIPLQFAVGELVRARAGNGRLYLAKLVGLENSMAEVETSEGLRFKAHLRSVFKVISGTNNPETILPVTPADLFSYDISPGPLRRFLNAAAKFGSTEDFQSRSPLERMELLGSFMNTFMPWRKPSDSAEHTFSSSLGDLIVHGLGVCRHISALSTIILNEMGYNARLTWRLPSPEGGHAWVEVDLPQAIGGYETFVLDFSNGDGGMPGILSMAEVEHQARINPESLEAIYYAHPERRFATNSLQITREGTHR